ncbi:MAG: hypothetical protein LQ350_001931 [Teloschistes chrysophthalmus]|nr:MAG: hypothetical protein LQ350_001931 [Niorma chrysophthalma]
MAPAPFLYISGYPGVGKLTVANELSKLLPNAKVLDNHTIINPAATLWEEHMPEYDSLCDHIRQGLLNSIATSPSLNDVTLVFTDVQPDNDWGITIVNEYLQAAETRDCLFISIILECTAEENCHRMMTDGRGKHKLRDQNELLHLRECQPLHRFGIDEELVLNTTDLPAYHAARKIVEFMRRVVPKEDTELVFGDLV